MGVIYPSPQVLVTGAVFLAACVAILIAFVIVFMRMRRRMGLVRAVAVSVLCFWLGLTAIGLTQQWWWGLIPS